MGFYGGMWFVVMVVVVVVVVVVVTIVGYDLWGCGCGWQWWCGSVVHSQTGRGKERDIEREEE